MADGAILTIDGQQLDAQTDRVVRAYLSAGTATIGTVTKRLERSLETATQAAVPGRMWRAWASRCDPKSGPARDPVGRVYVNGGERSQRAMFYWTRSGSASRGGGRYWAIPLPAAGSRGRGRLLTPLEWEARHNTDLEFVPRRGKPPLLVAQTGTVSAKTGRFRRLSVKRLKAGERGNVWVPMFVLIPLIRMRGSVAVAPLVTNAGNEIAPTYAAKVAKLR